MTRVLMDEIVMTDFRIFHLIWGRQDDVGGGGPFAGQVNGLVGTASPDRVELILARRHGGSAVKIVLLDRTPSDDPTWEDVVEVSITVPPDSERVMWAGFAAETSGPVDLRPGQYRLRVSARGRDRVRLDPDFVDSYLLELWTGAPAPEQIVRTTTKDATYWHVATRNRQPPVT